MNKFLQTFLRFIGVRQAARDSGLSAKEANQQAAIVVALEESAKQEADKKQ